VVVGMFCGLHIGPRFTCDPCHLAWLPPLKFFFVQGRECAPEWTLVVDYVTSSGRTQPDSNPASQSSSPFGVRLSDCLFPSAPRRQIDLIFCFAYHCPRDLRCVGPVLTTAVPRRFSFTLLGPLSEGCLLGRNVF